MNHLTLERVQFSRHSRVGGKAALTAQLPSGGHGLLVSGTAELSATISVLAGEKRPHRGRVLVQGRPVLSSPDLRARLSVLPPKEDFEALAATAGEHLQVARAWRQRAKVSCWDSAQRLGHDILSVPIGELTLGQRRMLQLEVAFAVRDPLALLLAQPLEHLSGPDADWVLAQIERAREAGAICLFVSSNEHQLAPFCEQILGRPTPLHSELTTLQLRVERPREIAARVQALPSVVSTHLDPERSELLQITGSDANALCTEISRIVLACDSELQEMTWLPKAQLHPGPHSTAPDLHPSAALPLASAVTPQASPENQR